MDKDQGIDEDVTGDSIEFELDGTGEVTSSPNAVPHGAPVASQDFLVFIKSSRDDEARTPSLGTTTILSISASVRPLDCGLEAR